MVTESTLGRQAPASPRARWTLHAVPPAAAKSYAGALFGDRYLLGRRIGVGGMSTVYEAHDAALGTRVTVKILRDDLPGDRVDRFRREAHVLAGFNHEHIARIIDRQDLEDGTRFLVSDYIDGHNLNELNHRGPMPVAVVLQLGLQVAAALAYAHEAGVIHRDIKPSNLMLARHHGGDIFVKVIDFGIAKLVEGSELAASDSAPAGARRATRGDIVLGTTPYWCGREGPQADVYALALTLAVLLTAKVPPVGAKVDLSGIPPALAAVLDLALALGDELATMDALHAALREVSDAYDSREAETSRRHYFAEVFQTAKPPQAAKEPAPPVPSVAPAPRFGERYVVCGELGQGGMGRVRMAFDLESRRRVALKTIHPHFAHNDALRARIRREARALAAIEHTGVPFLHDLGNTPEPYFTMEIVKGVPLAEEGKIEPLRALTLAIDLAGILVAAHEVGIVHRDVKPDNILIGKGDRVRLLDFGVCLFLPRYHQRDLLFPATPPSERYETGTMEIVGTPGYTAPEVLAREGTSTRSDIYSVCAVLYGMLTGRSLIDRTTSTTRTIHRGEFPAALAPVAELLRSGTAREPSDRPRNMSDLAASLEVVRAGLLEARERGRIVRVVALTAGSVALVALILVALFAAGVSVDPAERAEETRPATSVPAAGEAGGAGEAGAGGTVVAASVDTTEQAGDKPEPVTSPSESSPAPRATTSEPGEVAAAPPGRAASATSPRKPPSSAKSQEVFSPASIARLLQERREDFRSCSTAYHRLRLTISKGHATLLAVDGMTWAEIPLHTCFRDHLRPLAFTGSSEAPFVVPLDLRPSPKAP